jgi:hypothetical protein
MVHASTVTTWEGEQQAIRSVAESLGTNLFLQNEARVVLPEGQRLGPGDHELSSLIKVLELEQAR